MNSLKFTPLCDIAELSPLDSVDIIGVVHVVGPVGQVTLKNGSVKERRNLLICDQSNISCCICFWGETAHTFSYSNHPVIAVKNAKVSDFAHKSLNANEESHVFFEPNIERAKDLRDWYEGLSCEAKDQKFHALSIGTGLESMMKEPEPDETIHRFCTNNTINPEEATNISENDGLDENGEPKE